MERNQYNSSSQEVEYEGLDFKKTLTVLGSIFLFGFIVIALLSIFKPEAKKKESFESVISVNAEKPQVKDYPIIINSNGSVAATTSGALIAQVSGEITKITEHFGNGADFKKGDLLLSIDTGNYLASVSNAKANLSQAQSLFETEQANAAQAKKDWVRLGYEGEPSDRVLRKPQLSAVKAQLSAAKAALDKAQLDFSRTQIKAPYDGSVISKRVSVGQFVSMGTQLGEIFSSEGLEIQLPLNQKQYAQLDTQAEHSVTLSAELAGITHEWPAHIIRVDRAFDPTTRLLNATAKVDKITSNNGLELKIGQYVNANIHGRIAKQAFIIPNSAVREGSYIFTLKDDILNRQNINIVWQDDKKTIIKEISPDTLVVSTSLSNAVTGTKAKLIGDKTAKKEQKEEQKEKPRDNPKEKTEK